MNSDITQSQKPKTMSSYKKPIVKTNILMIKLITLKKNILDCNPRTTAAEEIGLAMNINITIKINIEANSPASNHSLPKIIVNKSGEKVERTITGKKLTMNKFFQDSKSILDRFSPLLYKLENSLKKTIPYAAEIIPIGESNDLQAKLY